MSETFEIQTKVRAPSRGKTIRRRRARDEQRKPRRDKTDRRRAPSGAKKAPSGAIRKSPAPRNAVLVVKSIKCKKKTRELLVADKIVVTAVKVQAQVDARGETCSPKSSRGRTINAGKFKKGDQKRYREPKTLVSYPLGGAGLNWPRRYQVQTLCIEQDGGRVAEVVNQVIDAIDDKVAKELAGMASTAVIGALGAVAASNVVPVVGPLVTGAVTAGVMAASRAIQNSREDDVFPPQDAHLVLREKPRRIGAVPGSKKTLRFNGHGGEYEMEVEWHIK